MKHPEPFRFRFPVDSNPFSVLSVARGASSASDLSAPPQPRPSTTPRPQNIEKLIHISVTYSTSSARVQSFQEWPCANVTPQQLAKLGFYHSPQDGMPNRACCFICGAEVSDFNPTWAFTMEELMDDHEENCLWVTMLGEVKHYIVDSQKISLIDASLTVNSQPSVDTYTNI